MHLRFDAHARLAAHVQRADALRAVGLVRGQAHQIDRQRRQVDRDLAGGLRRIDVEDDAALTADRADRRDVLDHADLVVDEHHRDQDRVRPQRRLELVEVEQAVFLHVEVGDVETLALQLAHRVEHRLVLCLHGDQVLAARLVELRRALDREVVRLGRTRRPDDLARVGADQRGDVLARLLDHRFGFPAPGVAARRGVAEVLTQPRDHRVNDTLVHRVRGGVVDVDREVRGRVHGRFVGRPQPQCRVTSRRRCRARTPSSAR
jgi:SHS2 domain-containing protein